MTDKNVDLDWTRICQISTFIKKFKNVNEKWPEKFYECIRAEKKEKKCIKSCFSTRFSKNLEKYQKTENKT